MDNNNMTDEQYQMLYNRIKTDLYNEFINPETATYGLDVVRQQDSKQYTPGELLLEEIESLTGVMKEYEENEEYEQAAFIKKRIENLKKRL
jgi:protein-arginine kinase activator protein McsA